MICWVMRTNTFVVMVFLVSIIRDGKGFFFFFPVHSAAVCSPHELKEGSAEPYINI